jgi:hypothetical protein
MLQASPKPRDASMAVGTEHFQSVSGIRSSDYRSVNGSGSAFSSVLLAVFVLVVNFKKWKIVFWAAGTFPAQNLNRYLSISCPVIPRPACFLGPVVFSLSCFYFTRTNLWPFSVFLPFGFYLWSLVPKFGRVATALFARWLPSIFAPGVWAEIFQRFLLLALATCFHESNYEAASTG